MQVILKNTDSAVAMRQVLVPVETSRCVHVSRLGPANIELVRAHLETFGALETLLPCSGHVYGFATFACQQSATDACGAGPLLPGVKLSFARRERPVQHSAGAPRGGVSVSTHKVRRKRRRLGLGEPVAYWAKPRKGKPAGGRARERGIETAKAPAATSLGADTEEPG
eukprot:TRINITY_DN12245_c0_g1_i1.p1 TRINITY_DN12245_c0_g1~~TRINITY_DN12245_c0_g1_i1.p1  ORF type:complete len:168 (+),score=25.32 TRINITY_DN12245_c0_g1_i1:234-737(+)